MSESPLDPQQDPVYIAAAEWLCRMQQSNLTLEDTLGWQQWMAQDAQHARAFEELEALWEKFDSVAAPPLVSAQTLRTDTYDGSVPVGTWRAQPGTRLRHDTRRMGLAAMLLITLTGLVGSGSLLIPPIVSRHSPDASTFETAVGQNATVRLPDGSRVQLGGHTRLSVTLKPHLRQVELLHGEACFEVAKDRARPFVVRAGTASVTAVGTEFNVRRSDDRVVVSVLEGRVLVEPLQPAPSYSWIATSRAVGAPAAVSAGQRTTVDRRGLESTLSVSDASSAVAWEQGRLAFESEPLRYVIQDVNRYAEKPIVIGDARTGDLRVTGTVAETNIMGWINSLEAAFAIHADIQPDRIVLRRPD